MSLVKCAAFRWFTGNLMNDITFIKDDLATLTYFSNTRQKVENVGVNKPRGQTLAFGI